MKNLRIEQLYEQINFLPEWYIIARQNRRVTRHMVAWAVILFVALSILWVQISHQQDDLNTQYNELAKHVKSTERQIDEMAKLKVARKKLIQKLMVHRKLRQPITYSQIVGTLAALTPEAVALSQLEMKTEKITVTRRVKPGDPDYKQLTGRKSKRKKGKGKTQVIRTTRNVIVVEADGIVPTNVVVADYVGQIAASQLFNNVKMIYSRQGRHGDLITRQFRIRMEVPLDRRYVPIDPSNDQEVADAN